MQKLSFQKKEKKENLEFKDKKMKMSKKIEISKFIQRFYVVEISKTIVSLAKKHVKVLLNNKIEIFIITFEILN